MDLTFSLKAYGEHLAGAGQLTNALWLYSQVSIEKQGPTRYTCTWGAHVVEFDRSTYGRLRRVCRMGTLVVTPLRVNISGTPI